MRLIFPALFMLIFFVACEDYQPDLKIDGEVLIEEIETFLEEKGHLPENLNELGREETESGPLYYLKKSETHYIVWFGTTVGESVTWDSEEAAWSE